MANHAWRKLSQKSIDCGQSFTLLGRQSRYGAEALAASVLALGNRHAPVWCPPPKLAGLVLRDGFRRPSRNQRTGIEMKAIVTAAATNLPIRTTWQVHWVEAKHRMSPTPILHMAVQRRTGLVACASNLIFCLSLWMSLLVAIWLTRGWIGLFFSGQLLSAGAGLFETLSKGTQNAFTAGNVAAHELEGDRNE